MPSSCTKLLPSLRVAILMHLPMKKAAFLLPTCKAIRRQRWLALHAETPCDAATAGMMAMMAVTLPIAICCAAFARHRLMPGECLRCLEHYFRGTNPSYEAQAPDHPHTINHCVSLSLSRPLCS